MNVGGGGVAAAAAAANGNGGGVIPEGVGVDNANGEIGNAVTGFVSIRLRRSMLDNMESIDRTFDTVSANAEFCLAVALRFSSSKNVSRCECSVVCAGSLFRTESRSDFACISNGCMTSEESKSEMVAVAKRSVSVCV